jgi:uncharacterized membrane protein HdeD (DUF308 family)
MNKLDKIGIYASLLCAIHCAIMPLIVVILPILTISLFVTETVEWLLLISAFIVGISSLCLGFKKHKSKKVFPLLSAGFILILIGKIYHNHNFLYQFNYLNLIMILGGILITFSHYINNKLCNSCKKCHI